MNRVWGNGKEIILPLHVGLPFMDWDDFSNGVRKKLAPSHLSGRHQAPVTPPTNKLVRLGDDDMCLSEE
eukprot:9116925-Prorocentrum_lima.AAC.1